MSSAESVAAGLAGAEADRFLDVGHEDLAVADASGAGRRLDRLDRAFGQGVVDHHLELHLGQEIDDVLRAAIQLRMALWRPKPLPSVTVMPWMPTSCSPSFTSSSLNGLMIASIFFMGWSGFLLKACAAWHALGRAHV